MPLIICKNLWCKGLRLGHINGHCDVTSFEDDDDDDHHHYYYYYDDDNDDDNHGSGDGSGADD